MSDFLTVYTKHRDARTKANELNKVIVFDALAAAGITHVTVEFDGEGDSGQINGTSARAHDKPIDIPTTAVNLHITGWDQEELTLREMPLCDALEDLCYGYLEQEHGGWENNDGAYGEFHIDVTERTIDLEFYSRYTDCEKYNHSF
jgi:hypothetical protein